MVKAEKNNKKMLPLRRKTWGNRVCDSCCTGFKNISFWYKSKKKNHKGKKKSIKMKY